LQMRKVKVPPGMTAMQPMTRNLLLNLGVEPLVYEMDKEFPVLEILNSPGHEGGNKEYHVCIWAYPLIREDINNLLKEAFKNLSYAGLRPRHSVLTGCVKDRLNAEYETIPILPNLDKPFYSISSSTRIPKETRAGLSYGEDLALGRSDESFSSSSSSSSVSVEDEVEEELEPVVNEFDYPADGPQLPSPSKSTKTKATKTTAADDDADLKSKSYLAKKFKNNGVCNYSDPGATSKKIVIYDDLDDVAAWLHWQRAGLHYTVVVDNQTGRMVPKWPFTHEDTGMVELRPLPTERNQAARNAFYVQRDPKFDSKHKKHHASYTKPKKEEGEEAHQQQQQRRRRQQNDGPYGSVDGVFKPVFWVQDHLVEILTPSLSKTD